MSQLSPGVARAILAVSASAEMGLPASPSAWLSSLEGCFTSESLYEALVRYWTGLKILLIAVSLVTLASSIDDFVIDVFYWDQRWRAFWRGIVKWGPSQKKLERAPEKRMAIMAPAWKEAEVIAEMVANTNSVFLYKAFDIFIGVYANDPDTLREVERVRRRFANVHRADVPHDGPTSKADCLNWLVQNILRHEQKTGLPYDVFVMHDAEDVVHPFGLKAVNWFIQGCGMIQLPVLSMPRRWWQFVAGHYMDEFAEFHTKDLPVRTELARMTPSAGVATAFSREAMLALCRDKHDQPFNTDSLTEDYDVGHRLKALGFKSEFIRYRAKVTRYRKAWFRKGHVAFKRKELVATREFFPDSFRTSVRQKSRWMLGISYMGWLQLGWFGSCANRYFLFRDRKALITAPTGFLGYLIVLQYLGWRGVVMVFPEADRLPPLVDRDWVWMVIELNFFFLMNRLLHRAWFTGRAHGLGYIWLTPVRVVVANVVGFYAFGRSMRLFLKHLITRRPIAWDKTQHSYPSLDELELCRDRLGDELRYWNQASPEAIEEAARAQKIRYRPIGLQLLDQGAVDDEALAEAFAQRDGACAAPFDPLAVDPALLRLLPQRDAARFGAIPLRREDGVIEVALAEPLSYAEQAELTRTFARSSVRDVGFRYAPLSDVAFALKYAWTPADLAAQRRTVEKLRAEALIDGEGEARLWRSVRKDHVRLGDLLVRQGAIEHRALKKALAEHTCPTTPLGDHLVAGGWARPEAVAAALKSQPQPRIDMVERAVSLGLIDRGRLAALSNPAMA